MDNENPPSEVTITQLAAKVDVLGKQLDWLCQNMAGLFAFIEKMGNSGGGIRGIMSALKESKDVTTSVPVPEEVK